MGPVVTTFMTTDAQAYGAAQKIQNGASPIESTPANDSFTEELSLNWGRLGWQLLSATPGHHPGARGREGEAGVPLLRLGHPGAQLLLLTLVTTA